MHACISRRLALVGCQRYPNPKFNQGEIKIICEKCRGMMKCAGIHTTYGTSLPTAVVPMGAGDGKRIIVLPTANGQRPTAKIRYTIQTIQYPNIIQKRKKRKKHQTPNTKHQTPNTKHQTMKYYNNNYYYYYDYRTNSKWRLWLLLLGVVWFSSSNNNNNIVVQACSDILVTPGASQDGTYVRIVIMPRRLFVRLFVPSYIMTILYIRNG